jgi:hypothetical protein
MTRFDVRSADETSLAVWTGGTGTPLVLVHGSVSDHTTARTSGPVALFGHSYGANCAMGGAALTRQFICP